SSQRVTKPRPALPGSSSRKPNGSSLAATGPAASSATTRESERMVRQRVIRFSSLRWPPAPARSAVDALLPPRAACAARCRHVMPAPSSKQAGAGCLGGGLPRSMRLRRLRVDGGSERHYPPADTRTPVSPAQLHHCRSQGSPSLFPSIFVFGQLRRKYSASAHDVICEQWVRPSHRNVAAAATGRSGFAEAALEAPHGGSPAGALACAAWITGASGRSAVRVLYWSKPTRATAPSATSVNKRVSFMPASGSSMASLYGRPGRTGDSSTGWRSDATRRM